MNSRKINVIRTLQFSVLIEQAWKVPIEDGYNPDIKNPHIPEEEQTYGSAELPEMPSESFRKSDVLLHELGKELK